ncbi:MAG TPA: UDP-N-acetylmuramoyl-tripeptide--D-alanyl-D-alanine ligase [Planctomycetaceae bacterium]|jgi:UDP-N-acetylmuramoyl-tripeptide--D-alanyl-D-alanine ligase|nr:UDP-N-acetylmuramoyl-tripeptide--D-alanyl-D-alanine ligase [Planctomycetaceae bacterium]
MLPELIKLVSRLFVLLALGPAAGSNRMERVTLDELQNATGGRAIARDPAAIAFNRVTTDSRTASRGDLFWALQGPSHDGHDFIQDAIGRGAVACVVQENKLAQDDTGAGPIPTLVVPDVLKGLQDFARSYRQRMDALVIGITGTVGKTTTRELVHSVLSSTFEGCRSRKNFNNHIGLPLSVLDIERRHEFAVLELAASHRGEIRELTAIARPEVGLLTSVGVAHLDGFGSIETITATKAELLESLPASGFAVINGDDSRCRAAAARARCRVITVGEAENNNLRATSIEVDRHAVRFNVEGLTYGIPAIGSHHVFAGLFAIAVAREVGIKHQDIAEGLARFVPAPGRCQVRQHRPWTVIDDTYNANPSSTEAACRLLSQWDCDGHRTLVLADMLELGAESAAWHVSIGQSAARLGIDRLIAFGQFGADCLAGARGEGMHSEQLALCDSVDVVGATLDCWLEPGDVVLVKGSRSMQMERVVEQLISHMSLQENIAPCPSTRACA